MELSRRLICGFSKGNARLRSAVYAQVLPGKRSKSYYITTPIYYVNASPHIGHLYTASLADARQRYEKLKRERDCVKEQVIFATGTDEHGQKIQAAALKYGLDPKTFCDNVSMRFKDLFSSCGIGYTDFIRTTDPHHKEAVHSFWKTLFDRGYIYKGYYEGWYSTQEETFLSESDTKVIQGKRVASDSGHNVEWTKEENYLFRLSDIINDVKKWYEKNTDAIYPAKFYNLVMKDLCNYEEDISISRERSRVSWGIPTPSDPTQTVYVWLDALVNYLTVAGYPDTHSARFKSSWPADCHLIGQDILKFHAVYWPAFLLAAGLEPPNEIVVHSHWLMEKRKMSKSVGNVVDPFKIADCVSGERLKYFLLKQGVLEHDCDFSDVLLLHAVNNDLSHTLGNCLNRSIAPKLCTEQKYPPFHANCYQTLVSHREGFSEPLDLIDMVTNLPKIVESHCETFCFYKAAESIMACVREANALIHRNLLWNLDLCDENDKQLNETAIHCVFETLRVSAILLKIFTPHIANKLLDRLNINSQERTLTHAENSFLSYHGLNCPYTGRKLGENRGILAPTIKSEALVMK